MTVHPFLYLSAALVLGACAPGLESVGGQDASASSPRQCFTGSRVRNFRSDGSSQVYVRANDNTVYEMNTGGCPGLDVTSTLVLTSDSPIGDQLCVGEYARITVPGSTNICRARVSRALTAEEVASLPRSSRP